MTVMAILAGILLVVLSLGLGVAVVRYLTVHPLKMSQYLFLACVLLFLAISVIATQFGWPLILAALAIGVLAFLAGYTYETRRFLSREDDRPVPAITRAKDDPGKGHTAIVYFTHGEPETFDPIGWINQFREFDHQGIAFAPLLVRPFFVYKVRQKYLQVGASGHRRMHEQMIRSLEARYREAGDTSTRFYICFLDDNPRPDAAVIQALNEGASRIVVAEVFLTISNHTAEGKALIEEIGIHDYNVDLRYTGPMWDSAILKGMYVQRANIALNGVAKADTGVLLVGHGQPDQWDEEWPTLTEQEISFRQDILARFVADGYPPENLSLAWMMFKEPAPGPKIEEWHGRGLKQVIYIPAAISAEAIHSQADIPELVEGAKVPPEFRRINLGAWNNDPLTITAIKAKIDPQLN
jgi:sirohydrochlorin ferrochelatase